jgi:hypothetical protein
MLIIKLNNAFYLGMMAVLAASDDLGFLSDITTKAPANYIIFSLVGLYSSITFVCIEEKRWPNGQDFMKLIGYIPFVWGLALLIGTSPLFSLFIGIAPEPAFKFVRRKAERWLKKQLGDDKETETDDKGGHDGKTNDNEKEKVRP